MWNFKPKELVGVDGERVLQVRFWEVGKNQRQFKKNFQKTAQFSTAKKAFEEFRRRFFEDEDFRNEFFLSRGWETEKVWNDKKEAERLAKTKVGVPFIDLHAYWRQNASAEWSAKYAQLVDGFWAELKSKLEKKLSSEITKAFLIELDAGLRKGGNSRSTVNRKIGFIRAVMSFALENERISMNPVAAYRAKPDPKPKTDFWERSEAAEFLAKARERYPKGSPRRWIYVAYLTALNTGLRANELWALRPSCMLHNRCQLWIHEQWSPLEKKFVDLKSTGQERRVPMNDELYRELMDLVKVRGLGMNDLFFGVDESDPWFRSWCPTGKPVPVDHHNFSKRAWQTDLKKFGGRKIRFHDLRHTAATLMISSGIPVTVVKDILGHTDLATTMRYVHALGMDIQSAATKFALVPDERSLAEMTAISAGEK